MKLARLFLLLVFTLPLSAQVLKMAELNTEQINALDRAKTAIIIPGGILEEHGPYLPSGTDTYFNERVAHDLANAVVARPGWTAVMLPTIPLGAEAANVIGMKQTFPATFDVSASAIRSVYMDLADDFGALGFRWIFVIHNHGGPLNHRAINDAGDYFHDLYKGEMVHLYGIADAFFCCEAEGSLTPEQKQENGFTVHASASEHSMMMFLRPDLVATEVKNARSWTGRDFAHLMELAKAREWPGYFGAPRHASASKGAREYALSRDKAIEYAMKILDGADPRSFPRYADIMAKDPQVIRVDDAALAHEAAMKKRQEEWLAKRQANK